MRVAAYVRVSSKEQLEGYSIDAQTRAVEQFCAARGWTDLVWYEEPGRSAWTDDVARRPAFRRMLADAKAGEVGAVVVHRLDRFARSVLVTLGELRRLSRSGVTFASVVEQMDFTTPIGQVILATLAAFAEYYSANLSAETKKGIAELRRQGRYHGGDPFGAIRVDGRLAVDPARAEDLRALCALAARLSDVGAARALNAREIRAPRSARWGPSTVAKFRTAGGAWLLGQPGDWPALYRAVRARPTRPPVRAAGTVRALSGLLRCRCGGVVVHNARPRGRPVRLRCRARGTGLSSCCRTAHGEAWRYEGPVARWLLGLAIAPEALDEPGGEDAARAALEAERRRVAELYRRGLLTDAELDAAQGELARREARLPPGPARRRELGAGLAAVQRDWGAAPPAARNAGLRGLLARVVVGDGRLTLVPRPELAALLGVECVELAAD